MSEDIDTESESFSDEKNERDPSSSLFRGCEWCRTEFFSTSMSITPLESGWARENL